MYFCPQKQSLKLFRTIAFKKKNLITIPTMTLQQMEYIVAVYRWRHFAKAAKECGVTQPTLSQMIQKLENELGVKIFERTSQQVVPTAMGKMIVEQAWKVVNRAKRIKDMVNEAKESLSGTFRIGILPTIAPYLLPRFFPQMMEDYPELQLHVTEMQTSGLVRALERGEIDAAIAVSMDGMDKLVQTPLFYEQFFAYVSRKSRLYGAKRVTTADLDNQLLWMLDEGHCFRDQLVKFCSLKSAGMSKDTYRLGSIETFMRMVEAGLGMTFIPELAVEQLTGEQRQLVRPFAIPIPTRQVVLLTTASFIRQQLLQLLAGHIRKAVPERMLQFNNTEQRV